MSNADARVYASGLVFHSVGVVDGLQSFVATYTGAFEETLRSNPSAPTTEVVSVAVSAALSSRASWPFTDGDDSVKQEFTTFYAKGMVQTAMSGLVAHGYALTYAGYAYTGSTADEATKRADVYAAGFALSESACRFDSRYCDNSQCVDGNCSAPVDYAIEDRFTYARAYERGHVEASNRVDSGSTHENAVNNWASVYAQSYMYTHTHRICLQDQSGSIDFNFAYERRRYNPANIPTQNWATLELAHTCGSLLAHAVIDLGMSHNPELHASAYYQGARHVKELGLNGQEADDYAFDYYLAYYQARGGRNRDFIEEAHIYAAAYARVRRVELPSEESFTYAQAYLEAFELAKQNGLADEDAQAYASAFAEAQIQWPEGVSPP